MAIANPILTTALTLGATVTSLAKLRDGQYSNGSSTNPITLTIKAASPVGARKRVSITFRRNAGPLESFPTTAAGHVSASFQLEASLGATITEAAVIAFISELGSLLGTSTLTTALMQGSYA